MSEPPGPAGTVSVLAAGPAPVEVPASVEYLELGQGPDRLPLGATLLRAATIARGDVVVVLAARPADDRALGSLGSILFESGKMGAVVPRVVGPDGVLLEAGAEVGDAGTVVSCGAGDNANRSEYSFARPVHGTRFGCVALLRSLLADMAIDPDVDEPAAVVAQVLAHVHAVGREVVYLPTWTVIAEPSGSPTVPATPRAAAARPGERILVVAGTLSSELSPWSDGGIYDLLDAVVTSCPAARLTVVVAEGLGTDDAIAGLRAGGIEVAGGGTDWSGWFADRAYHFSHVIVTDGGLQSCLGRHAIDSQPQAAKVLWTATLGFRAVEGMLPVTPYIERVGHEYVRATVAAHAAELISQFDMVWCASVDDYHYLTGMLTNLPVKLLPQPVPDEARADTPYRDRRGLAVVASPGADIVAAHEDAAACAAEEIFSHLHRRDPRLQLTIIADRPSPMVERLALLPGVAIEHPGAEAVAGILARARVVVAPYRHGVGGRAVLRAAMTAGTPFLTTVIGARGVVLGDLEGQAVLTDPLDIGDRVWALHGDADAWHRYRISMGQLVRDHYLWPRYRSALAAALTELGVGTVATGSRRPEPRGTVALGRPTPLRNPRRVDPPALRVAGSVKAIAPDTAAELAETVRYRLWCHGKGPIEPVLASLRRATAALSFHPRISVVAPVGNADPSCLHATLASVQAQIYEDWELCLADDGSDPAVKASLDAAAADDPRIRVVHLVPPAPGVARPSGSAAAANAALSLATGDYVAFVQQGDLLKPHALAQVVRWLNADPSLDLLYSDEDRIDESGRITEPVLKPDWSPDLLTSRNYVNHLLVARRLLVDKLGGFRSGFEASGDYDLVLRLTEETERIAHIPEPLYSDRGAPGPAPSRIDAKALQDAMRRRGQDTSVDAGLIPGTYRVRYAIAGCPRVAIVIPTRDKGEMLRRCVDSIVEKSTYKNYEIVVIDNESKDPGTLEYLATLPGRVLRYPAPFNYARMLNLAVQSLECDALLFLNNDTEVMNGDWIEALLEHGMRPEVGAVGCRLYYPDGRLQHEGILVGILGIAYNIDHGGLWGLGDLVRNCSAVTGACVMMRPAVYWAIGGNDERLRVAYNDVDICLRIHQAGYEVVYTPYARLSHFEGASRARYEHVDDRAWFSTRWRPFEEWDPYYNRTFDRNRLFKIAL